MLCSWPMPPKIVLLALALILSAGSILAQADGKGAAVEGRVAKAIAAWTDLSSVTVTDEVSRGLSDQAIKALDEIPKRNAELSRGKLEVVAPRATVEYLRRSTDTGRSPPLADLMEQLASGTGALLPAISDFPTLKINVKPPGPKDFIVNIDGRDFAGGRSSFRVGTTEKAVAVSRGGKVICNFKVSLMPGAVHTEECPAKP